MSTDNENREPTPLSWRKTTVPSFPGDDNLQKAPIQATQVPMMPPTAYVPQHEKYQKQDMAIYSTLMSSKPERNSLHREPEPSPPPPLPSSQPPAITNQQLERTFIDELKQRNNRQQR